MIEGRGLEIAAGVFQMCFHTSSEPSPELVVRIRFVAGMANFLSVIPTGGIRFVRHFWQVLWISGFLITLTTMGHRRPVSGICNV